MMNGTCRGKRPVCWRVLVMACLNPAVWPPRFALCLAPSIIARMDASEMARVLGRKGGRARDKRLSVAEKQRIASLGGQARSRSLEAARRIAANFRYAAVLAEFRGQQATVERLRVFAGPLPGIYHTRS